MSERDNSFASFMAETRAENLATGGPSTAEGQMALAAPAAEITADQYHADDVADVPTLSRSIAHLLCTRSPAHAYAAHPKLNPNYRPDEDPKYDIGTVCHELILGGEARIAIIDAADWRTNAAKEERHRARVEGKTPLLAYQWEAVQEMAEAVTAQIRDYPLELLGDGDYEKTLTWEDEGVLCRARLDFLSVTRDALTDLKTTSISANPEDWSMFSAGGDLQAWMYSRAVEVVFGVRPVFRFVVAESSPPYAVSVIEPGPDVLTLARKKFSYAAGVWRSCLDSGVWPGYDKRIATVGLPSWLETKWLQKEERMGMVA